MRKVSIGLVVSLLIASFASTGATAPASVSLEKELDMEEGAPPRFEPGVTDDAHRSPRAIESGGRAIAYRSGGTARLAVAAATMFRTGFQTGEPTMGVSKDGTIFVQALAGSPQVFRSKDGGRKWEDVSPKFGERNRHPESLDPFLYVDPATDRVFTYDFLFGCSEISFTDDLGKTWTTTVLNCGEMDHQNLFAGPPVTSPTVGYPNVVYTCSTQAGATIYSVATQCLKSLDGGLSWVPTGTPPFVTDRQKENDLGIEGYCHGAIGHGYVGSDGTVYIPKGLCGQPWLAISHDEGATWTRVQVADNGMPQTTIGVYEHEASVASDDKGNVYYFWMGHDRLPYLAVSKDGGETWGKPMMVGPPGLKEAALPHLDAGGPGGVAVVYYGSTNSPGAPFPESDDCKPDPAYCFGQLFFLNPPDPKNYADVTWNGYMTVTANALDRRPTFLTAPINDPSDPFVRGTCGPIRCKAVYDFIDVSIDRAGVPWAIYVDACVNECSEKGPTNSGNEGVLGTIRGGPPLR
jgi:photosystem II stability/assembly factor-like uncharacterized protein